MKVRSGLGIALAISVSVSGWVNASTIERPTVMPDAMISVTVSDLHGLIDGIGSVAAQVSPMANGVMIKNMLGMQLNDPGLSGIAPGKGLAIVALDPANVFAYVEVNEEQVPAYTATLSQQGVPSRYVDGVLVIAKDAAAPIDKGVELVAAVKETLLAKRSPTLRVSARPAELYATNQAQVDGMMQMMPMMMGMSMMQSPEVDPSMIQSLTQILQGEMMFLISLARQCESTELVLAPQSGSLRISQSFVAVPDSRLATLLNAPKVNQADPNITSGLLGDYAIAVDSVIANPEALSTFFCEELDDVVKSMGIDSEVITKLNASMKTWMDIYGGSFSQTVSYGGDNFINVNCVMDIKDEAAAMEKFRTLDADMAPVMELYKSMGMPITFESKENSREYKGVSIHQFKVGVTMPEEQQGAVEAMNMDLANMLYDYAICDGVLLYAMGGGKIETLIDRVKDADFNPEPLKARSEFPAGGNYYCDVDVAEYMAGLNSVMPKDPNNPLPQLVAILQGADPVTSAGFTEDGAVMWSVNVPGSLLAKAGQAVMMMQMQQMQQMQQAPQPVPADLDPISTETMPEGLESQPVE